MFRGLQSLLALICAALFLSACGGEDTPDTDGGMTAKELAAKLPDGGFPQAIAADVDAAREAAGLEAGADPTEVSTSREELRFGLSTFVALRDLSALTDNPVRAALDHGMISAYAAHPYVTDEAITLLSTSQDFGEIADSLEEEGWERDGDVISTEGDPEQLTYTALAAADGFIVLGYSPDVVEAVASGDTVPSDAGELAALENLDAPVIGAVVPEAEGAECIQTVSFEDFVDESFNFYITIDGKADVSKLPKELPSEAQGAGFELGSEQADGDTITLEMSGTQGEGQEQLVNSPAVLVAAVLDETGPLVYDCA